MSKALVPVLTKAGLTAVVRAQGDGLQATISRVALGRGAKSGSDYVGYVPSKDATALANEMQRVPLLSGSKLTAPTPGFRVLARVPEAEGPTGYWVREIGLFLSDGTLFALWSDPAFPLEYRTGLADLDLAIELLLTQVPIESIAISVNEPDIPDLAGALAALLREQTNHFIASLDMNERLISRGI